MNGLMQRFSTSCTRTSGGTPDVFHGVRRWLAEAKGTCNCAKMSLCVVHEGEIVFL